MTSRGPVAAAATEIRAGLSSQRDKITAAMAQGLAITLSELHRAGSLQGVIAVAGMTGTLITLPALKGLPFGLPKVLVSSATALPRYADYYAQYFSLNDITVMHSVVDTVGMNAMLRNLLLNGAGAICGNGRELRSAGRANQDTKPAIAITEYGFAEKCAHLVREQLEHEFDLVSFHAQGLGDMAVEHQVGQGRFEGLIDLVPVRHWRIHPGRQPPVRTGPAGKRRTKGNPLRAGSLRVRHPQLRTDRTEGQRRSAVGVTKTRGAKDVSPGLAACAGQNQRRRNAAGRQDRRGATEQTPEQIARQVPRAHARVFGSGGAGRTTP